MSSAANTGFVRVGPTGTIEDADLPAALRTTSGTAGVAAASTVPVLDANQALGGITAPVKTLTTTAALTIADSGSLIVLNSSTSFVVTLPAASVKGAHFWFNVRVATGSGVGHIIRPAGTDQMRATVITTPANTKGLMNTQATSHLGDSAELISDGTDWYVTSTTGTWTREA